MKYFFSGYLLTVIGLFLYSYTQVDLNLTMSQASMWQSIQKSFQDIGWFQRPLSKNLYIFILFLLFLFYFWILYLIKKEKITPKQFWILILVTSGILLFSYNALSYDLFNYMFDARIFTYHNQDPYTHRALDYTPQDPWTNFMRWTHRTYPYGPVWLWLTIPLSYLGFQFFLPTLFLFKALMVGGYLGTAYFTRKILKQINNKNALFGLTLFAFNPLILIESLISAHHDIVMMFFVIVSFYFLIQKKYIWFVVFFFLSIGIKFATIFLLPVFGAVLFLQITKRKINWEYVFGTAAFLMLIAILFASQRTELQPWYFLWVFVFVPFLAKRSSVIILTFFVSLGMLWQYVPYIFNGSWPQSIQIDKIWITVISVALSTLFIIAVKLNKIFFKSSKQ